MKSTSLVFRASTRDDDVPLRALLESVGLPTVDVATGTRQRYVLAYEGDCLVGSVGLEIAGADALARSLAVVPGHRGRGLATALNDCMLAVAREHGVTTVYLLTTTAAGFAARRGFERISRVEVPEAVAGLAQFRTLCPATAVCMRRKIDAR